MFRPIRHVRAISFAAAVCLAALAWSCTNTTQPVPVTFKTPGSIAEGVQMCATAFEGRSAVAIDTLLAPDFVFRFQQVDIASGAPDSLTRSQVLSAITNFFDYGAGENYPAASRVRLTYQIQSSSEDTRIGHAGWKKEIVSTDLDAEFPNGNDLLIESPAEFYFRPIGTSGAAWKLAEWQDLPASDSPAGSQQRGSPTAVARRHWGELFLMYLNGRGL